MCAVSNRLSLGIKSAANCFLASIAGSALSAAADAQVLQGVTANITLTSDYRFRGISASDREPVFQGGVDANLASGLYVGTWASQIADFRGSTVEIDFYGGSSTRAAGFDVDFIGYAYAYPGGHDANSFEGELIVGRTIGPIRAEAQLWVAPRQADVAIANRYLSTSLRIPLRPGGLSAQVHVGYDNGTYDGKWDWSLGASITRGSIRASLSYVDVRYEGRGRPSKNDQPGLVAAVRFIL